MTVCALGLTAHGEVRLPHVFGSNMVLQRDQPLPVWGWAEPGEKITAFLAEQTVTATTDAAGAWRVTFAPLQTSAEGLTLTVTGANTLTLTNILVGEVWLCSGQSNMQWGLGAAVSAQTEVAAADYPQIRLLQIPRTAHPRPQADFSGAWTPCTPASAGGFSAVGYFFGRHLHRELKLPIGLIHASWGGTRIEPWTPPAGFEAVPELADLAARVAAWDAATPTGQVAWTRSLEDLKRWLPLAEQAVASGKNPPDAPRTPLPGIETAIREPTCLYNTMIHPLLPLACRGAIWYQGESNGSEGESYRWKMKALIDGWRKAFANPELAFVFVQLANFQADSRTPAGGNGYARLREAQLQSLAIPHTGMAVTIDIGEGNDIHPRNKQDVGYRLAAWALSRTYGKPIVGSGPRYRSQRIVDGRIRIAFDDVGGGLVAARKTGLEPAKPMADGKLERFAIAGEDRVWQWAEAVIEGGEVVVSSPAVPAPVAVRYAFDSNPEGCNLYNREGFPASPFRTDNW